MDSRPLAARPSLEQYKKQAKELVKALRAAGSSKFHDSEVIQRVRKHHLQFADPPDDEIARTKFALADAQLVIAREHGFESWPKFAKQVEATAQANFASSLNDPVAEFIVAGCVPRDGSHVSGTLERAEAILVAHPELARAGIHTAAILGDASSVQRFLALDAGNATAKGGPHDWDALTHLCFSRYLRLDSARSDGFAAAAKALLDAGARANTGWYEMIDHPNPRPTFESAIYGAAGIAQHAELTRLLLERGADPNDEETPYHVPETRDNTVMKILVESGKLNDTSLTTMLLRKTDLHDYEGLKCLLEHGADPNRPTRWGRTAFQHALLRDNGIDMLKALLEHGADPTLMAERPDPRRADGPNMSAVAMAARRGRGDVLDLMEQRGIPIELQGVERLITDCARNEAAKGEEEPAGFVDQQDSHPNSGVIRAGQGSDSSL
ncbi:MAG: ankyrin repeat domain-containing protein [Candidatus Acidiferrum sp.]